MGLLNYSSASRRKFAAQLRKLVNMKQQKQYCVEATFLGDGRVSVNGQVYEAAQVVDLDLWPGKPVVIGFDESKTRAYILGD